MRGADLGLQPVLGKSKLDPRREVADVRLVVGMLELATAAFGKVTARRRLVVRAERQCSVIEHGVARNGERHMASGGGHSVAAGRDPDDKLVHRRSSAAGIAAARSSAIMCGPAISAARP